MFDVCVRSRTDFGCSRELEVAKIKFKLKIIGADQTCKI